MTWKQYQRLGAYSQEYMKAYQPKQVPKEPKLSAAKKIAIGII